MIKWEANEEEKKWMEAIVAKAGDIGMAKLEIMMNLEACHCNGCPLDLEGLAGANLFDIVHDICGIANHIDHLNGKLDGRFLPRFAK